MHCYKRILFPFLYSIFTVLRLGATELSISSENFQECYGEAKKYVSIEPDPMPKLTVHDILTVKALIPEEIKNAFLEKNVPFVISVQLQHDPDAFSIVSYPEDTLEIISDEGGEWEWVIKAREAGSKTLFFRIGILENRIVTDNCMISIGLEVKELPILTRVWQYIQHNWIAMVGWLIAIPSSVYSVLQLFKRKK